MEWIDGFYLSDSFFLIIGHSKLVFKHFKTYGVVKEDYMMINIYWRTDINGWAVLCPDEQVAKDTSNSINSYAETI